MEIEEVAGKKIKVMLHYSRYGVQRSPNAQFDLMRENKFLTDKCEFITLDQSKLPREIGHIQSIKNLMNKIKKEKPDIVHILGVKEGFHCVIAALLAGCKSRILVTHGFEGYSNKNKFIKKMFYRWIIEPMVLLLSTHVQCNSWFSYNQQMIRLFANKKRTVVYNFLEQCDCVEERIWRKKNGIDNEVFLIATIGNMHSGKGYDILADVIRYFNDNDSVKFVIMGDGPIKKTFDELVSDAIKSKKVFSLGNIPHNDAMQILSECDLFVLPTRFETLGMVFAEAALYGITSIGTKVGAVDEIVQDKKTGYLVKMDDKEKIKKLVEFLYKNPEQCRTMGEEATRYIREIFSSEKSAKKIFEMYKN